MAIVVNHLTKTVVFGRQVTTAWSHLNPPTMTWLRSNSLPPLTLVTTRSRSISHGCGRKALLLRIMLPAKTNSNQLSLAPSLACYIKGLRET